MSMLQAIDIARVRTKGMARREKDIENLWSPVLRIFGAGRDASLLKIDDIAEYELKRRGESFRGESVRGQTIRREVQAIRRTLSLAEKANLLRAPINWGHVEAIKSDTPSTRKSGKLWTADEISRVLSCLSKKAIRNGVRDRLRLIQLTGLRIEELGRLDASWVKSGVLYVPHQGSKTRAPRIVPLNKEAVAIIERWKTFDYRSPNKALKLASAKAGFVAVLTPRDLRVFFVTHAARVNLAAARDLAGHTNIATTNRYLKSDFRSVLEAAQAAQKAAKVPPTRSPQRKRGGRNG